MEAFFWLCVVIALLGWYVGNETRVRRWFFTPDTPSFSSEHWGNKIQIAVQYDDTKPEKVKPHIDGITYQDRLDLARDIERASNGVLTVEMFDCMSYRQILETCTPDMLAEIEQMRSFLK